MAAKKQNKAISILERKMRDNPRSREFSRLANLYLEGGDLQAAIELCTAGLAEHPDYVTGRLVLGRCYKEQRNFDAAVEELTKVCAADGRNHAALKMLADIFTVQGRSEAAGSLYGLLADMEPDNREIRAAAAKNRLRIKGDIYQVLGLRPASAESLARNLAESGLSTSGNMQNMETMQDTPTIQDAMAMTLQDAPTLAVGRETVAGIIETGGVAEVTGSDIESQLDAMFGERGQTIPAPLESAVDEATGAVGVTGSDIESKIDAMFGDMAADVPAPPAVTDAASPTGNDVVDQLDELFGGQTIAAPSPEPVSITEDAVGAASPTGNDVVDQLDELFGGQTIAAPPEVENAVAVEPEPILTDTAVNPTGDDVVNQLNELFGGAIPADPDTITMTDPEFPESSDIDNALAALETSGASVNTNAAGEAPVAVADEITGDDVADKLDSLFGAAEPAAAAPEPAPEASSGNLFDFGADETIAIDASGNVGEAAESASPNNPAICEEFSIHTDETPAFSKSELTKVINEPAIDESIIEESEIEELPEESIIEEPAPEESVVEESITEESIAEEPVIEEAVTEETPETGTLIDEADIVKEAEAEQLADLTSRSVSSDEISGDDVEARLSELFNTPVSESAEIVDAEKPSDTLEDIAEAKRDVIDADDDVIDAGEITVIDDIANVEEKIDTVDVVTNEDIVDAGDIVTPEEIADVDDVITPEEIVDTSDTIIPEEIVDTSDVITPEEIVDTNDTIIPEEIVDTNDTIIPEEIVDTGDTIIPEEIADTNDVITPEEIADTSDVIIPEEIADTSDVIIPEEITDNNNIVPPDTEIGTIDEPVSATDEVEDKLRQLFSSDIGEVDSIDVGASDFGGVESSLDDRDTPFDLPDHVLTSTLADIYYQQGQPSLALHIYERLAMRNPEDNRLQAKIEDIREYLAANPEELGTATPVGIDTGGGGSHEIAERAEKVEKAPSASSGRKKKGAVAAAKDERRPLAGVRIKKKDGVPAKKAGGRKKN